MFLSKLSILYSVCLQKSNELVHILSKLWYTISMEEQQYVNISQAAKMLGVSRTLIYRLIERGELSTFHHPLYEGKGGPVRIPKQQVIALARAKGIPLAG